MVGVIRTGGPASGNPGAARTCSPCQRVACSTPMLQWHSIGILHWFAFAAFIVLSSAVIAATCSSSTACRLPVIGQWYIYSWAAVLGLLGTLGIIALAIYRQ